LLKGHWHISVRAEDFRKKTFITPSSFTTFGLHFAGVCLHRMVDKMITDFPLDYCYLVDLHVASPDRDTHLFHLYIVFERSHEFGLLINLRRRIFCIDSSISWVITCPAKGQAVG
jgi:hypothetical protein